jgi:hypothetical protein
MPSSRTDHLLIGVAYLAGLYLVVEVLFQDPDTEDFVLWVLPSYSAAWGFAIGRWWAAILAVGVVPATIVWGLASGDRVALEAGDMPGWLGWGLIFTVLSLPGLAVGIVLRRLLARSPKART